jgi:hypothetical protein
MRAVAVALLFAVAATAAPKRPFAYSADVVLTANGKTTRSHIWSDGTHLRSLDEDGQSGSYLDYGRGLSWIYSPKLECLQVPMPPETVSAKVAEEVLGTETVDGHPARKVKSAAGLEWRATDLQDLVIRRRGNDGSFEMHLEHIVLGAPDPKMLDFAALPCKYDKFAAAAAAYNDTTAQAPQAAGGSRQITFFDASCKQVIPLPLTMAIPSDYAIRKAPGGNCLFGTEEDLKQVIAPDGADFTSIHRGVFWFRLSENTLYDAATKHFVSNDGPHDKWAAAMKRMGAKDVTVTMQTVGTVPTACVTARMNRQKVYMLYIATGSGPEAPAALINYHPPAKSAAKDDEVWAGFVASVAKAVQ